MQGHLHTRGMLKLRRTWIALLNERIKIWTVRMDLIGEEL